MTFEFIETKRLRLKRFSPEDLNHIFKKFSKDEIIKILNLRTEVEFIKEEKRFLNGYSCYNKSFMLFLLIDKATDTVIGRGGLHNWNAEHHRAELGYEMEDELFKKKGLMTEAVGAFIEYGFEKMNLNRIEAMVGAENIPSLKIIEKYNFKKEGVLRQHYKILNSFEDSVVFSLLHAEYKNEADIKL